MCVLCDEEEDPFVEDQAKEERSLVPGYMYGNMYGYEGSHQEYNSSEEFENFLNQPVHVDNGPQNAFAASAPLHEAIDALAATSFRARRASPPIAMAWASVCKPAARFSASRRSSA
jgi:hypothetical protein